MTQRDAALFMWAAGMTLAFGFQANLADANTRQVAGVACTSWYNSDGFTTAGPGIYNTTGATRSYSCSFDNTSSLLFWTATTLTIYVWDANQTAGSDVTASACVHDWYSLTYYCDTPVSSNNTNPESYNLSPARTYWTSSYAGWFAYLLVNVPATYGASDYSGIAGYVVSN